MSWAYGCGLSVHECLAGSSGAWGSAMPPTVVYLGLVHAPLGGVDPRGALPQHSSISGCANLATMLWHPRFSSGPAFSLLSSLSPTPGLPRWDRGERGTRVQLWETAHCSATQNTGSQTTSLALFVFKTGTFRSLHISNQAHIFTVLNSQGRDSTKRKKVFDLHVNLYSWVVSVIELG